MPKWIHDRAAHIQAENPSMPESEAWAIATQQSHSTGHSPKGYGTAEGHDKAKKKYKTPDDDMQQAAPKSKVAGVSLFSSALVGGFCDELENILEKKAGLLPAPDNALTQLKSTSPKPTMGIKKNITAYSQPKTLPSMSPSQGAQPTAGAPQVKTSGARE